MANGGALIPDGADPTLGLTHPLEPQRDSERLDEGEIKAIVSHEIEDALGGLGSQVSEERRKALRFYYGREFGNEVEGRSKVVLTDVADTIEWVMPSLMRMFTGGRFVVKFHPRREDQVEAADQATEYINKVFREEQRGFQLLHDWFKTALLEKNGIVKVYYEERTDPKRQTYRGLSEQEVMLLLNDPRLEPIEFEQKPDGTIDVTVRQSFTIGAIKIDGVPPEEFLIARRTIELNDFTPFTAHRKKVTVSDLVALGYPKELVETLPSDDTPEYSQGRTERLSEDETFPVTTERTDPASREIWTTECYVRVDEDGDGYAELRKITVVGEQSITLLDDEEINWQPFCSLTPIPMPHKFFGLSLADQVSDLQLIRSTLLRQMLDNMYLVNNGRYEVVEGAVEMDDLLTSRPGGIVRVQAPGMVNPLPTQPFNQTVFGLMEFLDGVRETRTGITRYNQGIDAQSLNHTATGVSQIMNAAFARVELIARIFAETGVKDMFRKMLKLMVEGGIKPQVMRLRGKWVEIDPSTWDPDMDVEIQVGLGVGQAGERIAFLTQLMQVQAQMAQSGLSNIAGPRELYNAASKMAEAMGFTLPEQFFADPETRPPPEPKPDPDIVESERRAKDNAAERELKAVEVKADMAEAKVQAEFRLLELKEKMKLEREKMRMQERIEMARIKSQKEIAAENSASEGSE